MCDHKITVDVKTLQILSKKICNKMVEDEKIFFVIDNNAIYIYPVDEIGSHVTRHYNVLCPASLFYLLDSLLNSQNIDIYAIKFYVHKLFIIIDIRFYFFDVEIDRKIINIFLPLNKF